MWLFFVFLVLMFLLKTIFLTPFENQPLYSLHFLSFRIRQSLHGTISICKKFNNNESQIKLTIFFVFSPGIAWFRSVLENASDMNGTQWTHWGKKLKPIFFSFFLDILIYWKNCVVQLWLFQLELNIFDPVSKIKRSYYSPTIQKWPRHAVFTNTKLIPMCNTAIVELTWWFPQLTNSLIVHNWYGSH